VEFIRPQNPRGKFKNTYYSIGRDRPLISEYFNMVLRSRRARFGDRGERRETKNKTEVLRVVASRNKETRRRRRRRRRTRGCSFGTRLLYFIARVQHQQQQQQQQHVLKKKNLLLLYAFFNAKECTRNVFSACRSI